MENRLWYHLLEAENAGWVTPIQMLLRDWSEADPYHWIRQSDWDRITETRMLVTQLDLQRYFLEHHRLPDAVDELVPSYLSEVPRNSHVNQEVQYLNLWGDISWQGHVTEPQTHCLPRGRQLPT